MNPASSPNAAAPHNAEDHSNGADPPLHMTPDEFRRWGATMVELVASYWESLPTRDARSHVQPGDILKRLPLSAPQDGSAERGGTDLVWNEILHDLHSIILPGITHWQAPGFFGFFPANASLPAVLAELLSAGLAQQGMMWQTSPACTELETRVLDWMAELIALPPCFLSTAHNNARGGGGVIQGTASEATLTALVAARHRAVERSGPSVATHSVMYASEQAHSSVMKAAMIAGLADGPRDVRRVRFVPVDARMRMQTDKLQRLMDHDAANGLIPTFVCATVGTTSSGAIDDLAAAAHACRSHNAWLHVDAAWAGSACVCPEHRHLLHGVEHADSLCFNPHKWLLTNFDCDCFYVSDRAALIGALSIVPEYLRNAPSLGGQVIDYRDWHTPLGRRMRALKLWFVIRHYGAKGLMRHIRHHIRLAALFESLVRQDPRFDIPVERSLSLVCFRLAAGRPSDAADALTLKLEEHLAAERRIWLTATVLPGVGRVLRMAVGSPTTQEPDIRAAWDIIKAKADVVCSNS